MLFIIKQLIGWKKSFPIPGQGILFYPKVKNDYVIAI